MRRVLVVFAFGCGASAPAAPVDYGPPAAPVDPIACPAATLERFAARAELTAEITTEPILDASRVDKLPCKPDERDDACLSRARRRPVPPSYEVAGIDIRGSHTHVEFTYELDGRRVTEQAPDLQAMVARLKALQAKGHRVVPLSGESMLEPGSRHAAIAYRAVGLRQRRVATLRARSDDSSRTMLAIQDAAERDGIEIRKMEVTPDRELVVVATCRGL